MKLLIVLFSALVLGVLVSPGALAAECSVDVFELNYQDGDITGKIKNRGDSNQHVEYEIFIDDGEDEDLIASGGLSLSSKEFKSIVKPYNFVLPGDYKIRLEATAGCGAFDSEEMGHIILEDYSCSSPAGFNQENRCDYYSQEYFVCSGGRWKVLDQGGSLYHTSCSQACGDGVCSQFESSSTCRQDCYYSTGPGTCDVDFIGLDYLKTFKEGEQAYVIVNVKNDGSGTAKIQLIFEVDGVEREDQYIDLPAGSHTRKEFFYTLEKGSHLGEITARATCGDEDSRLFELIVSGKDQVIYFEPRVPPVEARDTFVSIRPDSLDMLIFTGKVMGIEIVSSRQQVFQVEVDGLPPGFAGYEQAVEVSGEGKAYVYITPDKPGRYEFTVSVTALEEGIVFSKNIDLFVVPEHQAEAAAGAFPEFLLYFVYVLAIAAILVSVFIVHRNEKLDYFRDFYRKASW